MFASQKVAFTRVALAALCMIQIKQISGSLTTRQIQEVAGLDDQNHFENALRNILVPRVVGTPGWKNVQSFIINELRNMEMKVELDSFEDQTPIFGKLNFVNIIGKLNPSADRFLVLSAHYDSKYFPNSNFVGATDSAVPCSLMLNIVRTILPILKKTLADSNLGLMLIFFDGEEAFLEWSNTDHTYGSRHLARKWEQTKYKNEREIDRISVLVLLDLIGSSNAKFVCTFANTCILNKRLREIEDTLESSSSLRKVSNGPSNIFQNSFSRSRVEDDHVPFVDRNIPVLHLLPTSFPSAWHTERDNAKTLNQLSILNFNKIMRVFVVEYIIDCTANSKLSKCHLK